MNVPDHLTALRQLLPPVSYTPTAPHITIELKAAAAVLDDLETSARRVEWAINPAKLIDLLPEWEAEYGLPDSCGAAAPSTIDDRLGALFARMSAGRPLKTPLLEEIADRLGFPGTTVTLRRPITCVSSCTARLDGPRQRFVMDVNSPYVRSVRPVTCVSRCTAPIAVFEHPILECVFHRLEPAYARFKFHYGA